MSALLALFTRSLRELLRSKAGYLVCGLMIGVIFIFLLGASANLAVSTAPGLRFLERVLWVVLAGITLSAVSYFASAITEEKEEGTLALLRMTDLSPLAILLGKSTSRLTAALLLLAAALPFTLLAVTLGGVSASQIFASFLTLGAYLILVANVALLVSVLSPRGAIASAITGGLLLGAPLLMSGLQSAPGWLAALPYGERTAFLGPWLEGAARLIDAVNPVRRLGEILQTGFNGGLVDQQFWWSLAAGAVCVVLAWLLFDVASGDGSQALLPRLAPRPGGRFGKLAPRRAWLVSALAWKDFHFLHGGKLVYAAKAALYAVLGALLGGSVLGGGGDIESAGSAVAWMALVGLAIELCLIGSRIVRDEIHDQTLAGLATLPFTMQHIMLMKLRGASLTLRPALFAFCAGVAMLAAGAMISPEGHWDARAPLVIIGHFVGMGYFAAQAWLAAHVAAHFSLKLKWGALPAALGVVLLANIVGAAFCIGLILMPIVALTYVPHLRAAIYERLEAIAAQE
jgi:ABC-type transport system involved in multi-copper enzyme maturation permease subunit